MNKARLKKLYIKGLSLRSIGKILKINSTTVLNYMKKFKIPRRKRTEIQIGKFGKLSRRWNGGLRKNSNGYILIYKPNNQSADKSGYIREHRYIVEQYIGRKLKPSEIIHHIDGNKSNNKKLNLYIFSKKGLHTTFEALVKHKIIGRFSIKSNLYQYRKWTAK